MTFNQAVAQDVYEATLEENQELGDKVADLQEQLESVSYMLAELLRLRGWQGDNDVELCQEAAKQLGEDGVIENFKIGSSIVKAPYPQLFNPVAV